MKVKINEHTRAANIRIVVRTAYSGRCQGSRLTSVAPGASIGIMVPRAIWVTAIRAPKTHSSAAASQRLGRRLPAASEVLIVADMLNCRVRGRDLLARLGGLCHAGIAWHFRDASTGGA